MDFELKTLTRARICSEKTDALIVLVPQDLTPGTDPLSMLASLAVKSGDLEAKPGKLLSAYRTPGIAATRVVLAGVGDASAKNVRAAVSAALGALKASNAQRVVRFASARWAACRPRQFAPQ
jgi:leucyl aminopeptidase